MNRAFLRPGNQLLDIGANRLCLVNGGRNFSLLRRFVARFFMSALRCDDVRPSLAIVLPCLISYLPASSLFLANLGFHLLETDVFHSQTKSITLELVLYLSE